MNGFDLQLWYTVKEKLKENYLKYDICGERISIHHINGLSVGMFVSVEALYNFLCGYEQGKNTNISNKRYKCNSCNYSFNESRSLPHCPRCGSVFKVVEDARFKPI